MYPIPPTETLVQTKTCRHCSASFPITDKDLEFYEKVSPSFPLNRHSELVSESSAFPNNKEYPGSSPGWRNIKIEWDKVRYLIPTPTLCPDCRQQRKLSFINSRNLYHRKCDFTGKQIISIYPPSSKQTVYDQDIWWSDVWSPMDYGREFDFGRGFFEQIWDLKNIVPTVSLFNAGNTNTEYANWAWWSKNCYLSFHTDNDEDLYYSQDVLNSKNCMDCFFWEDLESCYECTNCFKLYDVHHSKDSLECTHSGFLDNCKGCSFCFWCVNLVNKKYCFLNAEYSQEEYENLIRKMDCNVFMNEYNSLRKSQPQVCVKQEQCTDCSGSYLLNCNNIVDSFDCTDGEDLRFCTNIRWGKNMMDITRWWKYGESCYECLWVWANAYNILFSNLVFDNVADSYYCMECISIKNCFWCIGLRNKYYCILNKQYTREEYETLVPRIIEHMSLTPNPSPFGGAGGMEWGEFFPSSLSPFGYNETVAQEYYPLDRRDAINRVSTNGARIFNWSDYEAPFPKVEKIIPADKLPDDISKIPDDILNWAIECEVTKKPFRIIKQELEFYRKHNLPIPRRHPDQRHLDRMALRNPRKLFERKCDKCGVEMITTYSPERKEVVYCESCYNAEVVG